MRGMIYVPSPELDWKFFVHGPEEHCVKLRPDPPLHVFSRPDPTSGGTLRSDMLWRAFEKFYA